MFKFLAAMLFLALLIDMLDFIAWNQFGLRAEMGQMARDRAINDDHVDLDDETPALVDLAALRVVGGDREPTYLTLDDHRARYSFDWMRCYRGELDPEDVKAEGRIWGQFS